MKLPYLHIPVVLLVLTFISWKAVYNNWMVEKKQGYNLFYTASDKAQRKEYIKLVKNGIDSVESFFDTPYKNSFNIYIHPNRHSLDSTWQNDWNMPEFKSQCWMVASGVATQLDLLSPVMWSKEACEHVYTHSKKTQQLVTHELVHVFHGQLNSSPDFLNTEGIDWFVEGLATYASGQLDSQRIAEVKKAILENKIPNGLDNFWTGKLRYGLSGTVVMYIDKKYGSAKLKALLPFNNKAAILTTLKITEKELINDWKNYLLYTATFSH